MGCASKQVVQEVFDEDDVPLAQRKRRWARALKAHMDEAVLTHKLLLVAPLAKVTVPAPSKHINWMTTTMIMKTFPWTHSQPLSLGPLDLLVRQLKWHPQEGGLHERVS
jgi:hypothetical protein